jgi:hypothetical protein
MAQMLFLVDAHPECRLLCNTNWRRAWITSIFGGQLVLLGSRLLHWGYGMKEELRYRKAQSDLRKQQGATVRGTS